MKNLVGITLISALAFLALADPGAAAIPKKDAWYTQHYIIMQEFERKAYRSATVEARKLFQELFWAARTTEAKAKFDARLDYVMKNFWKENSRQPWNTDRARTYLLNGSPAAIDIDQNASWAMTALPSNMSGAAGGTDRSNEDVGANRGEIWTYSFDRYFVKYGFVFVQPNSWKPATPPAAMTQYREMLEDFNRGQTFGVVDLEKYKRALTELQKMK